MSGNSFGQFPGVESDLAKTGPFYTSNERTCRFTGAAYGKTEFYGITMFMNIAHYHNYDHKHNITADGGTEARPDNYTVRIWKRTA